MFVWVGLDMLPVVGLTMTMHPIGEVFGIGHEVCEHVVVWWCDHGCDDDAGGL